jgi:hypothetical protein
MPASMSPMRRPYTGAHRLPHRTHRPSPVAHHCLLLVEDDPAIARTVAYALEREGLAAL